MGEYEDMRNVQQERQAALAVFHAEQDAHNARQMEEITRRQLAEIRHGAFVPDIRLDEPEEQEGDAVPLGGHGPKRKGPAKPLAS